MAGNYPDVPAPRMLYDRDGTVGVAMDTSASNPSQLSAASINALNDESSGHIVVGSDNTWLGLIFPELRDITGICVAVPSGGWTLVATHTSVNSTNGQDGTWVNRSFASYIAGTGSYRSSISTVSWTGIKAIRFQGNFPGGIRDESAFAAVHLYGIYAANQNVDRLRIWHPTLDEPLDDATSADGAYLDWGDVARGTTQDRTFRIKNNSATLTANSIVVSPSALTDTSPTVVSQMTLSDGGVFSGSLNIGNLSPGAISSVITLRRTTASNATLALWAGRIIADPGSWT